VGADKVHLFLKTIHHEERADVVLELLDDDGAHGLTKEWSEVEWVCRQHEASRSVMERPESGEEEEAVSGYSLSPEESSSRAGSEELDLEKLIREACELVTAQFGAEGSVAESGPSGSWKGCGGRSLPTHEGRGLRRGRERSVHRYHGRGCGGSDPLGTRRRDGHG
jgi:hypothetical protein